MLEFVVYVAGRDDSTGDAAGRSGGYAAAQKEITGEFRAEIHRMTHGK
jgi:hypothetical protein